MASHDDDTMPEETQGYKLSQPKQSLAEYEKMGACSAVPADARPPGPPSPLPTTGPSVRCPYSPCRRAARAVPARTRPMLMDGR